MLKSGTRSTIFQYRISKVNRNCLAYICSENGYQSYKKVNKATTYYSNNAYSYLLLFPH